VTFIWTEQRIAWYLDASRYGDFHQRLAETIRPYLLATDRLCDLGCGLGRLDLALAPAVAHITCVDRDEAVLAGLRQEASGAGIGNLTIRPGDARDVRGMFDVALMVFFGYPPSLMLDCLKLASRWLIRVANARPGGPALQPGGHSGKRETAEDIAAVLDKAGYAYQLIRRTFEFGQPLASQAEAAAFLRYNSPAITEQALAAFLAENLVATGRADFPFYLPGRKELGIFIIDAS